MKNNRRFLSSLASTSQAPVENTDAPSIDRVPLHGFRATTAPRPARKFRIFPSQSPRPIKLAAAALTLGLITSSQAVIVSTSSVDFLGDFQAGALAPTDIPGVVPADQWGTANGNSGSLSHPDTLGGDMIDYEWSAPVSSIIGGSSTAPGDILMMHGFIAGQASTSGVIPASLRVSSIDLSALGWSYYDVFVYSDTGLNGGPTEISLFNPAATTYTHNTFVPGFGVGGSGTYIDSQVSGPGNYVRFDGLTTSGFEIQAANIPGVSDLAAINGIQIVGHKAIPEPSTSLLAILSTSLLLLRRKRV